MNAFILTIGSAVFAISILAAVYCWFGMLVNMVLAAKHRKPGEPFLRCMGWLSLTSYPERYTEIGAQAADRFGRCLLGFVLAFLLGCGTGLLLNL
jgi:hypothetical protein